MNMDAMIKYIIWAAVFAMAVFGISRLMSSLGV